MKGLIYILCLLLSISSGAYSNQGTDTTALFKRLKMLRNFSGENVMKYSVKTQAFYEEQRDAFIDSMTAEVAVDHDRIRYVSEELEFIYDGRTQVTLYKAMQKMIVSNIGSSRTNVRTEESVNLSIIRQVFRNWNFIQEGTKCIIIINCIDGAPYRKLEIVYDATTSLIDEVIQYLNVAVDNEDGTVTERKSIVRTQYKNYSRLPSGYTGFQTEIYYSVDNNILKAKSPYEQYEIINTSSTLLK
ncbi:hypothetical protein [Chitinophaga sp. CB10]|uniref:hypothetical protein n=1 Tax=Chitinophaga sp. CB10 TaxID=1891659 RepID=UPI0025B9A12B|nr:hypothetical protein [Chitinophaga sp. CB10]